MTPTWIIMPVMAGPAMTEAALADCLAQSVPVRVLLILQGIDLDWRNRLEQIAESEPRLLLWAHDPPLPSLSATWNRALQFVWEVGGTEALVVNNDVRLHRETVKTLALYMVDEQALFVSAVGVTAEQFNPDEPTGIPSLPDGGRLTARGGPDFSCFLISKAGHNQYPFDEGFVPLYGEDCDLHRRFMLGGDGERIFSINLPYHHIGAGSQTLKQLTPEKRQALERRIGDSRVYYARKWGPKGINHEEFTIPFEPTSAQPGVTNPELQAAVQGTR